jgi:hypothetical protein
MLNPSPFPPQYYIGYLNSRPVQEALGVPRNFTVENMNVNYGATGYDELLGGHLEEIGFLVDQGVSVALIYGDRDYSNNCKLIYPSTLHYNLIQIGFGGEAISKAVVFKNSAAFKTAGYQNVQANASYIGGQVRQVGKFSFTRVYDAGNEGQSQCLTLGI